jgi:hypothetical protein
MKKSLFKIGSLYRRKSIPNLNVWATSGSWTSPEHWTKLPENAIFLVVGLFERENTIRMLYKESLLYSYLYHMSEQNFNELFEKIL